MKTYASLVLFALLAGCGGGTQSLANSPEFDLPARSLGNPAQPDTFGQAVGFVGGGQVAVGAPTEAGGAAQAGQVHVFDATTGTVQTTLTSPQPRSHGSFGAAIAVKGGDLLVGAPGENRVYRFDGATGELEATIEGPPDEDFGAALAVVGDLVAIGAPRRNVGQGAVYLHDCLTGARVGRILSTTPAFTGAFGSALAALGGDLIVGAPAESSGRGAVHLVRIPDGRSLLRLTNPNGLLGGAFGEAVAAAAGDILVGAPGEERAYVFARSGALRHVLDNPGDGGLFGIAVHYADGHLLVAAVEEDGAAVYLFSAINGSFERRITVGDGAPGGVAITAQGGLALIGAPAGSGALRGLAGTMNCDTGEFEQIFESPDPQANGTFGDAVCILDDGRVVVAEPDTDNNDGAVHVFETDGTFVVTFNPPTSGLAANFGRSVAPLGNRVIIGEPGGEPNEQGRAYVGNPATGQLDLNLTSPDPVAGARFGDAVANVDGKIVVGEPSGFDNSGEGQGGAVHVFNDLGNLVHSLFEPFPDEGALFGASVAPSGTDYLVGAPGGTDAHCFNGSDGSHKQSFLPGGLAGGPTSEGFGAAVAGDDTRVFVGADEADVFDPVSQQTLLDAGRVHVFVKGTGVETATIESPEAIEFGEFGHRLSLSGNRIAISAPVEAGDGGSQTAGTVEPPREGAVHLYEVSSLFRLARAGPDDPNPNEDTEFGYGIFLKDDIIVIGSPFELVQSLAAGRAYRFDISFLGFMFSPSPTQDAGFGFSIAGFDDNVAIVGEPFSGNGSGAAYLIHTGTNQLIVEMSPSGALLGAGFGLSVAVLGNELIAVGAPGDAVGAGTVRIFNPSGDELAVIANPGVGTAFGFSVAAVGLNRLAIGAPGGDPKTGPPGRAYLYEVLPPPLTGSTANVNQLQEFVNPLGQNDDQFGFDVAAFGGDVLVGAPGANGEEGRAYRYAPLSGATPAATYQTLSPVSGERFGHALNELPNPQGPSEVAVGGPGTGNQCTVYVFAAAGTFARQITDPQGNPSSGFGFDLKGLPDRTLIVGAPGGSSGNGIAYVVDGVTGAELDELSSANPVLAGLFGTAVGCLTDGQPLVGAPFEDVNPDRAGRAYRFGQLQGDGEPPPPPVDDTVEFEAPNPTAGDGFGTAVAFSGTRVLVSAPCANNGSGEVYVYEGATAALLDTITNPGTGADKFGCSLDANALMIVVGASDADQGASGSGASYLYSAETRSLLLTFDLDDPQIDGGHGKASSVDSANILVGEPFADVSTSLSGLGLPDAGRASIYDCRVTSVIVSLESPNPQALGLFGCCVHIDGSNVYVAACGESGAEGRVYCFDLLSGQLRVTILPPTAQAGQFFGTSCATINGNVIVGAPGFDDQQLTGQTSGDEGIVYVINPNTGAVVKTLRSGNPTGGGLFGTSVATNGSRIIVGAPGEARGDGRVYVFDAVTCALLETLTPPAGVTGGSMGVAVAAMADNVLTGAPTANNTAGAAFLNPPVAGPSGPSTSE